MGQWQILLGKIWGILDNPKIEEELSKNKNVIKETFDKKKQMKIRTWHGHHAQDAVIIAASTLANQKVVKLTEKFLSNPFLSFEKKKKLANAKINTYNQNEPKLFNNIKKELNNKIEKIKFSYMINKKINVQLFNDTFYRGLRYYDKNKDLKLQKVSKTKLLIKMDKKDCKAIFENKKKYSKLACYKHDRKLFNELSKIYNLYKNEQKPFKKYMDIYWGNKIESTNYLILSTNQKIKKLRNLDEEKDLLKIIIPQKNNNRSNTKKTSFYESMNWIHIRLFKDDNNENKIIPITAINYDFHKKKIIEEIYSKQLEKNNISNQKYIKIYYGTILRNKKSGVIYRVCGHNEPNKLDLNPLNFHNSGNQMYKNLNTDLKEFELIQINSIGKIIKDHKNWNFNIWFWGFGIV